MTQSPRGLRPHLVLAGPCNAGKSSLLNALTGTASALVSPHRGTTTDPVYKNMELLPFGPVTFIDTPGLDDQGDLGSLRSARGRTILAQGDVVILVCRPSAWDPAFLDEVRGPEPAPGRNASPPRPLHLVLTHGDLPDEAALAPDVATRATREAEARGLAAPLTSVVGSTTGLGIEALRDRLVTSLEAVKTRSLPLLRGILKPGGLVIMVVPIDLEAPAGRLILPQVQAIREALDGDAATLVVKDRELDQAFAFLARDPDLVICDSQVVLKVASSVPPRIPLTTFSILLSRQKGDLATLYHAARHIDRLRDGDRVLVAETCTHKTLCDDIGRVKIPRWLRQYTGRDLHIDHHGGTYPPRLEDYALVIHCGGCMITRTMMLGRLGQAADHGVPITNYGMAISHCQGVLDRVTAWLLEG